MLYNLEPFYSPDRRAGGARGGAGPAGGGRAAAGGGGRGQARAGGQVSGGTKALVDMLDVVMFMVATLCWRLVVPAPRESAALRAVTADLRAGLQHGLAGLQLPRWLPGLTCHLSPGLTHGLASTKQKKHLQIGPPLPPHQAVA